MIKKIERTACQPLINVTEELHYQTFRREGFNNEDVLLSDKIE